MRADPLPYLENALKRAQWQEEDLTETKNQEPTANASGFVVCHLLARAVGL